MGLFPRVSRVWDDSVVEERALAGKTLFAFVSILNAGARPLSWGVRRWRGSEAPRTIKIVTMHPLIRKTRE